MSADSGDGLLAVTSGGGTAHHHDIPRRLIRRNPHRNQVGRLMEAAVSLSSNFKIFCTVPYFFTEIQVGSWH